MTKYIVKKPIAVTIQPFPTLNIELNEAAPITLDLTEKQNLVFEFQTGIVHSGGGSEYYPGPYTITPSTSQQILATHERLMYSNVTIYAIPYYEVNNVAYIADTTPTATRNFSKVVYGNTVLVDLTEDTVQAQYLKNGETAHLANGQSVTGTASWSYDATNQELIVPAWALEVE